MHCLEQLTKEKKERLYTRLDRVNRCIRERGIRHGAEDWHGMQVTNSDLLSGYAYTEFYDWDLYFENIYLSYYGITKFCRTNVEAFLDQQLECGFVPRTLFYPRMRQHFKPFLAQICVLGSRQTGSWLWLKEKYFYKLEKYLDYWQWFCDFDKNGLSVWDSADHSGMDNQVLRAGVMDSMTAEGVDLNSYLYREYQAMTVIAEALSLPKKAALYRKKGEELKEKINFYLWDEETGFYYDRNERTGELIRVKSASSFMPLWAGIAPADRAKRIVEEHLLNPEEFWLEYPVASWAKNDPGYYQQRKERECTWMGACWVCVNYMVMHGLVKYGYEKEAKILADKTFSMVLQEEDTREYYNAETGCGQGLDPFWGWSALGYFMPMELELKYDPTDLKTEKFQKIGKDFLKIEFER